ncbi:MAG: gliding motility-associated C-terminal domain-containing protein [Bacteroidia bacterium]|nr:gliding motility-associated C-terminal domain-containing protein [Bacteroidia bacterium]
MILTLIHCVEVIGGVTNDSIPPVFLNEPQDTLVFCHEDIDSLLTLWIENSASAQIDDPTAQILTTLTITEAIDSISKLEVNCDDYFNLGFYGLDTCGNASVDTLFAAFQIQDNVQPIIISPPIDVMVTCNQEVEDSLINWIENFGGAVAQDDCDTGADWINLIWEDNQGNSGFLNIGDPINFPVVRDSCNWTVEVSFFISDACGNINNTRGNFGIFKDNVTPVFVSGPSDTILLCNQILDTIPPIYLDECDGIIPLQLIEFNNRGADSLQCNYFNYTITRQWSGSDACQNGVLYEQFIEVVDTLSPTITFNNIIIKNCDDDLNDVSSLIAFQDNCSDVIVNFSDSLTVSNICQSQIIRTWQLEDVCGNALIIDQTIQIQDFSPPLFTTPPRDTMINCGTDTVEALFDNWVKNYAGGQFEDGCNTSKIFARELPNLTDTSAIINADTPIISISECGAILINNIISNQEVTFYTFDACGNIASEVATFSIRDTIAPVLSECPSDIEIILNRDDCETELFFELPQFEDSCLDSIDARWDIILDQEFSLSAKDNAVEFDLEVGRHSVNYTISDCANNTASCEQIIAIKDTFAPILICPNDLNIVLPFDQCDTDVVLPEIENFSDNCFGSSDFSATLPVGNAYLDFELDTNDSLYHAVDFPVEFDGIINDGRIFKPVIIVEYALNISPGSRVVIKSEFGDEIFEITSSDCEKKKEKILIEENQFIVWSLDNDIKFTIQFEKLSGEGVIPCFPENITGNEGADRFSFFKVTLQYSDIQPTFFVRDEQKNVIFENEPLINLGSGNYELIYRALDFEGNIGACVTDLNIIDVSSPTISCTDQVIEMSPDSATNLLINLNDLSIFIDDNCGIEDATFFPSEISCLDIDKIVPVNIQATDVNNNFSACVANLTITGEPLNPTFISGLCFADTLKLFANIDNNNIVLYSWKGPNNFVSNEKDPILVNINNQNSGPYELQITTDGGCVFEGVIDVQINQFTSPQINSSLPSYCVGEEILINSNSFTEDVNYFWYEGISPNGILIAETDGPTIMLTPSLGEHFYYVEVKGEGCNSNPSTTLEIEILPAPEAIINNPFISICEGQDIALSTDIFDDNFTYEWRGPDAYFSDEQFAEVINNANEENEGQYSLIINNGACNSVPAFAEVILFQPPPQPIIEGEVVFCEGQSSVLTVPNIPNATRYHWYFNGQLFTTVTNNNLLIPAINSDQSGDWTVVVENEICFSDTSDVFEIVVESSLNIGASNSGPVCEGDSITLTSSFIPNATYQWQDPSGSFYSGREINLEAIDGIYSVTVTTASNCTAITSTDVEVGDRPTITALSNTSLNCMDTGSSIDLVSTVFPQGNYQYHWSGPNNFESDEIEPTIQDIDQDDSGIYQLIVIQDNCASAPVETLVSFTINPTTPIVTGDLNLCLGEDLLLEITNPVQGNQIRYIWTTPLGTITTSEPSLMLNNFNSNLTGDYKVIQELNSCRSSNSDPVMVTLEERPPTPEISGSSVICEGDLLTLTVENESNAEFIWITPTGEIIETDNTLEIENIGLENVGEYQVYTQKTNCQSDTSDIFEISLIPKPLSPSFTTTNIEVCADVTQDLNICVDANNIDFDKIVIIDQVSGDIIEESNSNCFELSFLIGETSAQYFLNVAAVKNGCQSDTTNTLTIDIFESPDQYIEIFDEELFLCDQEFTSVEVDIAPAMVTPFWRSLDPEINVFDETSLNPSFSNLRDGQNTVIVSSSFGNCLNYAADTLDIFVLTDIMAVDDNIEGAYNSEIQFNPILNDNITSPVFFRNIEDPKIGNITVENNQVTIPAQTNFIGSFQLEYEICYEDCVDLCSSAIITINIGDNIDCFAGNIITPNGDGYNDAFIIPCLESGDYDDNSVIIFNQWGDEVFSASPYLNNWEGTFQNNKLPSGTYYYILNLGAQARPIQGFIILED